MNIDLSQVLPLILGLIALAGSVFRIANTEKDIRLAIREERSKRENFETLITERFRNLDYHLETHIEHQIHGCRERADHVGRNLKELRKEMQREFEKIELIINRNNGRQI